MADTNNKTKQPTWHAVFSFVVGFMVGKVAGALGFFLTSFGLYFLLGWAHRRSLPKKSTPDSAEAASSQPGVAETQSANQPSVRRAVFIEKIKSNAIGYAFAVLLVAGLGYYVWPTPYRYDRLVAGELDLPIRIHRISGKTEMLRGAEGWVTVSADGKQEDAVKYLDYNELSLLDGTLQITNYGWIKADIYNGTEYNLNEVFVTVNITNKAGSERLSRQYRLTSTGGDSLQSSEFIAECGCEIRRGESYSWSIDRASYNP